MWFVIASFAHALSLLLLATSAIGYEKGYCPASLPQKGSGPCAVKRQAGLALQRKNFQVAPPNDKMPFGHLNMTIKQYLAYIQTKPFLLEHAIAYKTMAIGVQKAVAKYQQYTVAQPEEMSYHGYIKIYGFFRSVMERFFGHKMRQPSRYELFPTDVTKYQANQLFAEQRLAGANPMSLQRITFSDKVGLNWNTLQSTLNPAFDWKKAVGVAIGRQIECEDELKEVIHDGLLFVLRYPLCDDMIYMEDIVDKNPNRTLWPFYSPIALFASVPGPYGEVKKLMPVAIQMDYKKDSKVYTPNDGSKWDVAKLNVQVTDLGYSQLVEHLGAVHSIASVVCTSMERHLSHRHPLYIMLQFHCRGALTASTVAGPNLISPSGRMHLLFAFGWKGAIKLLKAASEHKSWDDLDLKSNIKKRGVDQSHQLPYYPYRDDGLKVVKSIDDFVQDYVELYYHSNGDVIGDSELQSFAKEISVNGNGKIRGFPTSVDSVSGLRSILSRFIWLAAGQHSAINYAIADYGFVPNLPTKLYNDTRARSGYLHNLLSYLPQRSVSERIHELSQTLATLRFDQLFDYGDQLEDRAARHVVKRHYCKLSDELEPKLVEENEKRYKNGHLTYPYFMPRWLPNGIQT